MTLPPVQISIKRRREEEPVETLYIQSDQHQKKRRFNDFYFQKVEAGGDDLPPSPSASPSATTPQTGRKFRTPKSMSSVNLPTTKTTTTNLSNNAKPSISTSTSSNSNHHEASANIGTPTESGVPLVRATSPGAELREEKRIAAQRKEKDEYMRKALNYSPGFPTTTTTTTTTTTPASAIPSSSSFSSGLGDARSRSGSEAKEYGDEQGRSTSSPPSPVRKFQISRLSTPLNPLKSMSGGIQKKKAGDGAAPGLAVLVEKLKRKPHSREASMVADIAINNKATSSPSTKESSIALTGGRRETGTTKPSRPRRRPVVNQAERRWREERKPDVSAAKQRITGAAQTRQSTHAHTQEEEDNESDRLARQLEEVALELGNEEDDDDDEMDAEPTEATKKVPIPTARRPTTTTTQGRNLIKPPPLKYQPKPQPPKTPRPTTKQREEDEEMQVDSTTTVSNPIEEQEDADEDTDTDTEYVYDTYIRRPLPLPEKNPLLLTGPNNAGTNGTWLIDPTTTTNHHRNVGIIVIAPEDEEYWEKFVEEDEDDEDRWNSEDADSNAENNPANDYPDEELSSDDEFDDPTALYSRYRHRAASDDEEFDNDDAYDSEGMSYGGVGGFRSRWNGFGDSDDEEDSDDDGDGFHGGFRRWW